MRRTTMTPLFAALGALLLLFVTVPIVAMVTQETPASLWRVLSDAEVRSALWVSVSAAGLATAIAVLLGVPLGYVLARRDFPGKALVQGLVDICMHGVLKPTEG